MRARPKLRRGVGARKNHCGADWLGDHVGSGAPLGIGVAINGSKRSLRPNSRRRSSRLNDNCTNTAATERYQSQRSSNPGMLARNTAGIATIAIRAADVKSDGSVLPIAWNMLDATK